MSFSFEDFASILRCQNISTPILSCLQMANRDLLSSVSREFSGNVESGLKTICKTLFMFCVLLHFVCK